MQLVLKSSKQIAPLGPTTAQVQLSFQLLGILPDFVQIYARVAGETGHGDLVDTVDVNSPEIDYDDIITLRAGTYYEIYLCPRRGSKENPDDMIDGAYWEAYCVMATIITQASQTPGSNYPPPVITSLEAQPATLHEGNSITVKWSSARSYDQFNIWWTQNGFALEQVNIQSGGSSGSWRFPTKSKHLYTFAVEGGVYAGPITGHNWSGWGPTLKITAPANLTSLRQLIQQSGINPTGQRLRALIPAGRTLRQFMESLG